MELFRVRNHGVLSERVRIDQLPHAEFEHFHPVMTVVITSIDLEYILGLLTPAGVTSPQASWSKDSDVADAFCFVESYSVSAQDVVANRSLSQLLYCKM